MARSIVPGLIWLMSALIAALAGASNIPNWPKWYSMGASFFCGVVCFWAVGLAFYYAKKD